MAVYSVIKYAPEEEAARLEKQRAEGSHGGEVFIQPQVTTYSHVEVMAIARIRIRAGIVWLGLHLPRV